MERRGKFSGGRRVGPCGLSAAATLAEAVIHPAGRTPLGPRIRGGDIACRAECYRGWTGAEAVGGRDLRFRALASAMNAWNEGWRRGVPIAIHSRARAGAKTLVGGQTRSADELGRAGELRAHDAQIARRERMRPAIDRLPNGRQHDLAGMREGAGEHDDRRVQEVDERRQALADQAAGTNEQFGAESVAELRAVTDVVGRHVALALDHFGQVSAASVSRRRKRLAGDRVAARHGVEAAFGAAMADDVSALARRRVADEAGKALRAGMQAARRTRRRR